MCYCFICSLYMMACAFCHCLIKTWWWWWWSVWDVRTALCRGVFPFRRIPCKVFFPSFSFLFPFINAIQPFYGCQRNARKNMTVTVSVSVSVTVRVSLVWRHRYFLFRKISKWHGFLANWDSAKWGRTTVSGTFFQQVLSRLINASVVSYHNNQRQ